MRKNIVQVLTAIILISCQTHNKIELSLNLEKGKEYKQVANINMAMIQDFNGQKINLDISLKGGSTFLVKAINKDYYEIDVRYDSLCMTMSHPQGTMEFSSEKKDVKDIFSLLLAEMKDKSFQIKMDKIGKILEVKNIDSLFESALIRLSHIPDAQIEQIMAQLKGTYGEKAFRGDIEMVTAIFPDKLVAVGDSWEVKTKSESNMPLEITTTYKFEENNENYFLLVGESKMVADQESNMGLNGMPAKWDLKGNMTSQIKVDKISGWIIEAKINQKINGDVYMKLNPQMYDGIKIPIIIRNEIKYSNK